MVATSGSYVIDGCLFLRQERKMDKLQYEQTKKEKEQQELWSAMVELPLTLETKSTIFKVCPTATFIAPATP